MSAYVDFSTSDEEARKETQAKRRRNYEAGFGYPNTEFEGKIRKAAHAALLRPARKSRYRKSDSFSEADNDAAQVNAAKRALSTASSLAACKHFLYKRKETDSESEDDDVYEDLDADDEMSDVDEENWKRNKKYVKQHKNMLEVLKKNKKTLSKDASDRMVH